MPLSDPDPDPRLRLPEYAPMSGTALTDAERWPARSAEGAETLRRVLEHPDAPRWTHRAGDRLDATALERARTPVPTAGWLERHLAVARRLPAYRRRAAALTALEDFPTITRDDLAADVSRFVPFDADLDRVLHGTSSGSTGAALVIPDDAEELARGFLLLLGLVRVAGAAWAPDPERAAVAHVLLQRQAYTYASTVTVFEERPMARLNLAPDDWPGGVAGRDRFLAALDPQVVTGPPAALEALLPLGAVLRPLAIVSSATALTPSLRAALEAAFACPVLDLYGLHETRPIAVRTDDGPFVVLDRRVLVEVLDEQGAPVPPGQRGEIVVTAGENPFLPLVRYRTGDTGRLVAVDGRPGIADLDGRATVLLRAASGARVPSVDVTQQLQAAGCRGWTLRQHTDDAVEAVLVGGDARRAADALTALLDVPVTVRTVDRLADLGDGKPRRYAVDPPRR